MMPARSFRSPLPVVLLSLFMIAGCGEDSTTEPEVHSPLSTPAEAIAFFAAAHHDTSRSVTDIESATDPAMCFFFTSDDRAGNPDIPEYWERDPFLGALQNMFAAAVSVRMTLTPAATPLSEGACDSSMTGSLCRTYQTDVDLAVEIHYTPENLTLLVRGLANITLVQGEDDLWRIRKIVDRTSALGGTPRPGAGTEHSTWGTILALFR